nr:ABC transporter G family member 7 [Malus domestica]
MLPLRPYLAIVVGIWRSVSYVMNILTTREVDNFISNTFGSVSSLFCRHRISFGGRHIRKTMVAQSRIVLFWYSTTYLLLQKNKPQYQLLEAAPLDQIQPAVQLELLNTEQDEQNVPNEVNEQPVTVGTVELNQPPSESPPIDFVLEGDK